MASELSKLYVVLGFKDEGMSKALRKQRKDLQAFGKEAAIIGGAIVAAFGAAIKTWSDAGDEIAKMAKRTGFGTEAISELRHAADLSGTSLQSIEKASRNLNRVMLDSEDGLKEAKRGFDRLGLSIKDLRKLNTEEQFIAVIESIASIEDESIRSASALEMFGRAGTELLPMLADGADGLKEMREEAYELGLVFDETTAKAAEDVNDAMTRLKASAMGLRNEIVVGIVPELTPLIDQTTEMVKETIAWAKQNPELVKGIAQLTLGMGAFSLAIGGSILLIPRLMSGLNALSRVTHMGMGMTGLVGGAGALGAGLLTYGISEAVRYNQMAKDYQETQKINALVNAEFIKMTQGEANTLKELVVQYRNVNKVANEYGNYLDDLTLKQELQIAAQQEFIDKAQAIVDAWIYEQSAAGQLGITIEEVTVLMHLMGMTTEDIGRITQEAGGDINRILQAVGLSAYQAALSIQEMGIRVKEAAAEMEKGAKATEVYNAGIERVIRADIAGGISLSAVQNKFGKDWVDEVLSGMGTGEQAVDAAINSYGSGGIIPEPTLLYGLNSKRVYAQAGESGVEYVTPSLNGQSSPEINAIIESVNHIYLDGKLIQTDISRKQGKVIKDRLQIGGS